MTILYNLAMAIALSLVVPVFNEKENLTVLAEQVLKVMPLLKKSWELILVDDGSFDGSSELITRIAKENAYISAIHLTRNFGQTAALAAGIDHAQGEVIITLDADLQNDPDDIPLLLKTLAETKADIVSGWRKHRHDPWLRSFLSNAANWLITKVTGTRLHDIGCTLRVYRREVFKNLTLYGEMHRFIPALAAIQGYKVVEIPVNHRSRQKGQSKYGFSRTVKVLLDLVTVKFLASYQTKPIYMFGGSGLLLLFAGFLISVFIIIRHFLFGGIWVSPLLFVMVLTLIIGIQFVLMGLIAEIQIRTWFESSNKKSYQIKTVTN